MNVLARLERQKAPQLEVLRIGLGVALVASFAPLARDIPALYGDGGWMSRDAFTRISLDAGWYSAFALIGRPRALTLVYAAFLIAALAFTLGWAVRWVKWPLWALYVSWLNRNPALVYGADLLLANLLFLACVAPIGRSLVFGRASDSHPAGPRAAVCLALVRWQMAIVFFFTAIQKLRGSLWWSGDAFWVAINNIEFAQLSIAGFIAGNLWLGVLATHSVLLIELAYPFLVWDRRARPLILGAAIALHLATAVVFGLWLFAWVAIAGHLTFLSRVPSTVAALALFPSFGRVLARASAATVAQSVRSKEAVMKLSRISAAFMLAAFSAGAVQAQQGITAVPRTQADAIICPIQQITYGLAMNLPDPWTQTLQTDTRPWNDAATHGPYTMMVNGKEYLACRWKPDKEPFRYKIRRPASDQPPETWPCPAQVNARILSPIPSPWVGTTYPATLVSKTQGTLGGVPQNYCEYDGTVPGAILYQMPVTAIPTVGGLARNPRPRPTSVDNLAQVFAVTKVQLTAIPAKLRTSCPTTVRFEGRIAANGPGQVRWRRQISGQAGPLQTLNFTAAGERMIAFTTQVDVVQQQAAGINLTTQAQPSNVVNGLARILIESPQGAAESNVAAYEITCTPLAPVGGLAQPPAPPPPLQVAAPAAAGDPSPRRTTALAASSRSRAVVRTQRIPVRVSDGRTGWVEFDLSGESGGRPSGRIVLTLASVRTEYQVSAGSVQWNETDFEFILQGASRQAGSGAARRFSSRLKLAAKGRSSATPSGGVTHTDSWRVSEIADGDVWVIDGLTCQRSGRDLVCL